MPKNHFATFITNNHEVDTGSSLYLVLPNGTIRCSGANTADRKATVFTRPYTIRYFDIKGEKVSDEPAVDAFPREAEVDDPNAISNAATLHEGNSISEILNPKEIFNLNMVPKTWRGPAYGGVLWSTAVDAVADAAKEMKNLEATPAKTDKYLQM